jgi:hypothetical protein
MRTNNLITRKEIIDSILLSLMDNDNYFYNKEVSKYLSYDDDEFIKFVDLPLKTIRKNLYYLA